LADESGILAANRPWLKVRERPREIKSRNRLTLRELSLYFVGSVKPFADFGRKEKSSQGVLTESVSGLYYSACLGERPLARQFIKN